LVFGGDGRIFDHPVDVHLGLNLSMVKLPVLVVGVVAFLVGVILIHLVINRFSESPNVNQAILPYLKGYGALVLAMSMSALLCLARPGWSDRAAVMAGVGGILFLLSDGMIGLEKLDRRFPKTRFWVIFTYHLAQFFDRWGSDTIARLVIMERVVGGGREFCASLRRMYG